MGGINWKTKANVFENAVFAEGAVDIVPDGGKKYKLCKLELKRTALTPELLALHPTWGCLIVCDIASMKEKESMESAIEDAPVLPVNACILRETAKNLMDKPNATAIEKFEVLSEAVYAEYEAMCAGQLG